MITKEDIFRKIGVILEELNEQYHYLSKNNRLLEGLEAELFHANADFLANHAHIIKKLDSQAIQEIKPKNSIDVVFPPPLPEEQPQEQPQENLNVKTLLGTEEKTDALELSETKEEKHTPFEFIINPRTQDAATTDAEVDAEDKDEVQNPTDLALTNVLEEEETVAIDDIGEEILKEVPKQTSDDVREPSLPPPSIQFPELKEEEGPEPFIVSRPENNDSQTIEEKKLNINELFARNREYGERAEEATQSPITDLRQGISLNDKLLFIKDLFGGYNLAYSEAIDIINRMKSFADADTFLKKNYAVKNNWAAHQNTTDKLYALLSRRFS